MEFEPSNNVALDQSIGHRDGLRNGAAIISSFGQIYLSNLADGILVFLDVEGPPNPSLSAEYVPLDKIKSEHVGPKNAQYPRLTSTTEKSLSPAT